MSAKENERLWRAIGDIEEKYIEEADLNMKRPRIKRTVLIAAAAAVLLCGSAVATTSIISGRIGSSSSIPFYEEIPEAETVYRDFGFETNIADGFSNGYTFKAGYKGDSSDIDAEGKKLNSFSELTVEYTNGGDRVTLNAYSAQYADDDYQSYELAGEYNGITLYKSEQMYKVVPPDYELTEQDKADEASGKYVFSYGSDEVETTEFKWVGWVQNGVAYSLSGHDIDLTADDLCAMAEEYIDNNMQ